MEQIYKVEGMTCGGCARSVTSAIERLSSNLHVEVSVDEGTALVRGEHDPKEVEKAVEDAGFDFAGAVGAA